MLKNIKDIIDQFNSYKVTLNGAKATLAGFNAFLKQQAANGTAAGAALDVLKLKTIGLKAATVALNAAVSFGLSLLASLAVSGQRLFNQYKIETEQRANLNVPLSLPVQRWSFWIFSWAFWIRWKKSRKSVCPTHNAAYRILSPKSSVLHPEWSF